MKIKILCSFDGFANSVRPLKIKEFLEEKGHRVDLIDTFFISRMSQKHNYKRSFFNSLPGINIKKLKLYFFDLQDFLTSKGLFKKEIDSQKIIKEMNIRAEIIYQKLRKEDFDVLICENAKDSFIITRDMPCLKILDLPAPFVDETFFAGNLSKKGLSKLRKFEKEIYSKSDFLSFHWHNYAKYVKKNIYNGENFIELNWGCDPKQKNKIVKYSNKPKIICLGNLGGYWVNLPLLSKLSKLYNIDVYGSPKPDVKWGLNYKGYAPDLDILSNYQFGLITITKDKLRKSSFSSKHLEYLSYGLPVLTPEWRKDSILNDVSIYYNEKNFLKEIEKHSNKREWQKISDKAYKQARKLDWKITLKLLEKIIEEYKKIYINKRSKIFK